MNPKQPPIDNRFVAPGCEQFASMPPVLNVPDAKTARETVARGKYERAHKQFAMIEKSINDAIAHGGKCASGEGYLDEPVIAALRAKGYKVECGSHRNEDVWSVSW